MESQHSLVELGEAELAQCCRRREEGRPEHLPILGTKEQAPPGRGVWLWQLLERPWPDGVGQVAGRWMWKQVTAMWMWGQVAGGWMWGQVAGRWVWG